MKKIVYAAFASAAALALAACGSSDDASEEAMADNVEMPADEAMSTVEAPVVDPAAASDEESEAEATPTTATAEEAGDAAAAAAADVEAAAAAAEGAVAE